MEVAAGLYARISLDRAGAGLGVERQLEDCRELAARRGWETFRTYEDNDTSAFQRRKKRPAYERLIADARAGLVSAIVCWHVDRLTRRPRELEDVIDLADQLGLELATVTGEIDLSTPVGRMTARILGATARYESEHKGERQRRQIRQAAEAGKPGGGIRPFGWQPDRLTLHPVEAPVVAELAGRVLGGETMHALCRELTDRGVTTSAGNPWTVNSMRRMLVSARIAGLRENGGRTWPALWPPIVDEATRQALISHLERRPRGPEHRYLMTGGLAVCGVCGYPLVANREHGRRTYLCGAKYRYGRSDWAPSCGSIRVAAGPVEEHVAELALARLSARSSREALSGRLAAGVSGPALTELAAAQTRLADLAADYGDGSLSRSEYQTARAAALSRVEAARRVVARESARSPLASLDFADLVGWWDRALIGQRRALLEVLLDRVEILPATRVGTNTVDLSRVRHVWS